MLIRTAGFLSAGVTPRDPLMIMSGLEARGPKDNDCSPSEGLPTDST